MRQRPGRGWLAFSAIGIPLWIGATVAAAVLNDDPSDPGPVLKTFAAGAAVFFGLMFAGALWQQVRWRADSSEARFGKGVAIGYSVTGAVVTGLGIALVWQQAVGGGDVRVFLFPLIAIVVLWAVAAVLLVRRFSGR
jgi:hypothetical protein